MKTNWSVNENKIWLLGSACALKGYFTQKWKFCNLLTPGHSKPIWLPSVDHKGWHFEECFWPHNESQRGPKQHPLISTVRAQTNSESKFGRI